MGYFLVCGCSLGSAAGQVLRLFYFSLRWRPVPRWSRFGLSNSVLNSEILMIVNVLEGLETRSEAPAKI